MLYVMEKAFVILTVFIANGKHYAQNKEILVSTYAKGGYENRGNNN